MNIAVAYAWSTEKPIPILMKEKVCIAKAQNISMNEEGDQKIMCNGELQNTQQQTKSSLNRVSQFNIEVGNLPPEEGDRFSKSK